jgi:cytochrome c-type biogenesis protein CcmH
MGHSWRIDRGSLVVPAAAIGIAIAAALFLGATQRPAAVRADQPAGTQRELQIERSLACPQCTDLPLDVCDQDICNDMRALIHQKVTAGESDAAIRQYFVERYGTRVLLAPPKDMRGIIVWVLPFLALLLGAGLTLNYLRSAQARGLSNTNWSANVDGPDVSPGYRSRVEADLRELE